MCETGPKQKAREEPTGTGILAQAAAADPQNRETNEKPRRRTRRVPRRVRSGLHLGALDSDREDILCAIFWAETSKQ